MFQRVKFGVFLVMAALAFGCENSTVEPNSGAIAGSIRPAGAASKVYLISGTDTLKADPKTDSTYEFSEVEPGRYTLSGKPAYGYEAPTPGPIIVTAGVTAQTYALRLKNLPESGFFSITINDSVYHGSPVYELLGSPGFSVTSGPYAFRFELPKISEADSFHTATDPDLKVEVLYQQQTWEANSSQGSAALQITNLDPVTKRGDGEFSFTAVRAGAPDIVGSKGKLQFIKLRR